MKSNIQGHHSLTGHNPQRIGFERLREIINETWEIASDDFVSCLYDLWYDLCEAIIDARGGPTKYLSIRQYLKIKLIVIMAGK